MSATERAREGVDRPSKTTVTITEPGYYRIGADVRNLTCLNSSYTVVDGQGIVGLMAGNIYAPLADSSRDPRAQWIYVAESRFQREPLQFEISYKGDVDLSRLLPRDEEKEAAIADAIRVNRDATAVAASQVTDPPGAGNSGERPSIGCS